MIAITRTIQNPFKNNSFFYKSSNQITMQELTVKLKDKDFKLSVHENGTLVPNSSNILNHVGLEKLNKGKRLDRFYELCQCYKHKKAIRYVSYLEDISFKKARTRIKRYTLIDLGFRITWGHNENQRQDNMTYAKSEITNLLELDDVPATAFLIDLMNSEGFDLKYVQSYLKVDKQ